MYWLELVGEDDAFARREAATAAADPTVVGPGVAVADGVAPERLRRLAYVRRGGRLLGRCDPDVDAAAALLSATDLRLADGDGPADDGSGGARGSVAVRARDVRGSTGVSTAAAERALGEALVDRGFGVDLDEPDRVLRALFTEGRCVLGWFDAEVDREFARAPTDRPFFRPGSMAPADARALVNVAGAAPERTLLDPMCGTGGTLLEGALVGGGVVGADAQPQMVRGTRANPRARGDREGALAVADARALPLPADSVDCAVVDAPYGRQSKVAAADLGDLVEGALAELRRVVAVPSGDPDPTDPGRTALVADRPWADRSRAAGWTVAERFERPVHRSLTRHVHVLE